MPTYRAYRVDTTGKITAGEWLQASGDEDARRKAQELCDATTPTVELWQGGRRVCDLHCAPARRSGS